MSTALHKKNSRVQVEILGERYTIQGDAEPGYISEVAHLVDDRMRELTQAVGAGTGRARLAVLTAINLADELLQTRMDQSQKVDIQTINEVEERTYQLISLLDEGLIGDSDLV